MAGAGARAKPWWLNCDGAGDELWHGAALLVMVVGGVGATVGALVWMGQQGGGEAWHAIVIIPVSVIAAGAVAVLALPCSGWRKRRAERKAHGWRA